MIPLLSNGRHLEGRVALITGASSGIGREIATELASAGAAIFAVGKEPDLVEETAEAIAAQGGRCEPFTVEFLSEDAPAQTVDAAVDAFGGLDILVHSAGIYERSPFLDTSSESLDRHWRINFRVPFLLTQFAVPHLRRRAGAIVFVSSAAAQASLRNTAAYAASKAALEALTKVAAMELGDLGIRVNAIAPGFIETPMNEALRADPEVVRWAVGATPAGRLGSPADVAPLVSFLTSDAASFIHGAVIPVGGGYPTVQPNSS